MAQVAYSGKVLDITSNTPLANATIRLKGQEKTIKSDFAGSFLFRKETNGADSQLLFVGNAIVWQGTKQFNIDLINLSGQVVYARTVWSSAGSLELPNQAAGVYLAHFTFNGKQQVYRYFSNGAQLQIADNKAPGVNRPNSQIADTLIVSKEGYETRTVLRYNSGYFEVALRPSNTNKIDYLLRLVDTSDFNALSNTPSRSNLGQIKALKLVFDQNSDRLYYVNTQKHKLHYTFSENVLDYGKGLYHFNQHQYKQSPLRYLWLGDLNYYEAQDIYVLQFVASNEFNCNQIEQYFEKIKNTSYFSEKLFFLSIKDDWSNCENVENITWEKLYDGQDYQGLNLTDAYGYLRKVKLEDLDKTYLSRREIIVFDGIPNDVSVVAGIITSEFQTPLSHINVLSNSRGTPNMTLRSAFENQQIDSLNGELVYLSVRADNYTLRKASLAEAEKFWEQKEPSKEIKLEYDLSKSGLAKLEREGVKSIKSIGGKAAQFAEILKVRYKDEPIPTPEDAFTIPFYYYHQHLATHGINQKITKALANRRFIENPSYRQARLAQLRDTIISTTLSADLNSLVLSRIKNFQEFESYKFRSSTNAEDLEEFSGAGLYESHSAKKGNNEKTVELAIKKVWASLWNWRAFEERSYFKIDHESCMMGILVHRSFPDEDANGVILTTNLYNSNPGIIINAQFEEFSIVYPENGMLHDQIMVYTWSINRRKKYTIEYLSYSNAPGLDGRHVLADKEIEELTDYAMALKYHFFYYTKHDCNCTLEDFALDIEFKIDSQIDFRKVYIKQARIYKR